MVNRGPKPVVTDEELLDIIREASDPFVTASEVGEAAGVTRQTAHQRLQQLRDDERIRKKKIGASAVIWWIEPDGD